MKVEMEDDVQKETSADEFGGDVTAIYVRPWTNGINKTFRNKPIRNKARNLKFAANASLLKMGQWPANTSPPICNSILPHFEFTPEFDIPLLQLSTLNPKLFIFNSAIALHPPEFMLVLLEYVYSANTIN